MKLTVNGEEKNFPSDLSLKELIDHLGLKDLRFAVAVNRQIIPRSEVNDFQMNEGDAIEIVHAVGGG